MPVQLQQQNTPEAAAAEFARANAVANPQNQPPQQPPRQNADGLTMEQANDPQNWQNGVYSPQVNQGNNQTPVTPVDNNLETPVNQNKTKVQRAIDAGSASLQELMTATGLTSDQITQELNNDATLQNRYQNNDLANQQQTAFLDTKKQLDSINNGTFQLTADEQGQIDWVNQQFDKLREKQLTANANYEGAVTLGNIRTGRQEFMMDEAAGNYKQAIDDGVAKIADLDHKASAAVSKLKTDFAAKNYKAISDQYKLLNDYLTGKTKAINDMYDKTQKVYKDAQAAITANLNQQKLIQTLSGDKAKGIAPAIYESLTGDVTKDSNLIQQMVDYYAAQGIQLDPNVLSGEVNKYSLDAQKKEQALNKLTPRTYKGVTTWYNAQGQEVDPDTGHVVKGGTNTNNSNKTPKPSNKIKPEDIQAINQELGRNVGADGFISPDDYAAAKSDWISRGGTPTEFNTKMRGYRNPNNIHYKVGG